MPVPTLTQQFSTLSTADSMTKDDIAAPSPALVSPSKSTRDADSSFDSEESSQADNNSSSVMLCQKTEHKLKEEQGLMDNEPLLKPNDHRFVIFPIQDNDVSTNSLLYKFNETCHHSSPPSHNTSLLSFYLALGNVQKGRGFFLDRRGDRLGKRHGGLGQVVGQ